jgi:hypothetical protein
LALVGNDLQHRLKLVEDFAISKANHRVAALIEIFRTGLIVFDLLCVRIAVDLSAQFGFGAIEVDDEAIDRMLAAKL